MHIWNQRSRHELLQILLNAIQLPKGERPNVSLDDCMIGDGVGCPTTFNHRDIYRGLLCGIRQGAQLQSLMRCLQCRISALFRLQTRVGSLAVDFESNGCRALAGNHQAIWWHSSLKV